MNLNKANFLVRGLVPKKDKFRYGSVIHVSDEGTAVTNGHYLVIVGPPEQLPPGDLPTDKEHAPFRKKKFATLITTELAEDIVRQLDRQKGGAMMFRNIVWLGKRSCEKAVEFIGHSGDSFKRFTETKPESTFPKFKEIVKGVRRKPRARYAVNVKYLKQIADLFDKAGIETMKVSVFAEDKALKMEGSLGDQSVLAILMPLKADWSEKPKKKPFSGVSEATPTDQVEDDRCPDCLRQNKYCECQPDEGNLPEKICDDGTIAVEKKE